MAEVDLSHGCCRGGTQLVVGVRPHGGVVVLVGDEDDLAGPARSVVRADAGRPRHQVDVVGQPHDVVAQALYVDGVAEVLDSAVTALRSPATWPAAAVRSSLTPMTLPLPESRTVSWVARSCDPRHRT